MRRIYLGVYAALLTLAILFYCPIAGFVLKTAATLYSGTTLSYSGLHFDRGQMILNGVSAGKSGIYTLKSEKISVGFHWPCSLTLQIEQPDLTLSPTVLKGEAGSISGQITWDADVVGGVLRWVDDILPSGQFTFCKKNDRSRFTLRMPQGSLIVDGDSISCEKVPFEWIAAISSLTNRPLPIDSCQGSWSGNYDGKSLHAEGSNVSFHFRDMVCLGSGTIDWVKPEKYSPFPSRLRLSIQNGDILTPLTNVKNIDCLMTFQSGEWGMCEVTANCASQPLSLLAKGFFAPEQAGWMTADLQLGDFHSHLNWNDRQGVVNWNGFNSTVGSFLQDFTHTFDARVRYVDWLSGTIQGSARFKEKFELESVLAEDLSFKTEHVQAGCKKLTLTEGNWHGDAGWLNGFQFDGLWSGSKQELSLIGLWEGIPSFISWNQNGATQGKLGDCSFAGAVFPKIDGVSISLHAIDGKIPDLPFFQGTIISGNAGIKVGYSGSFTIDEWHATGKILDGAFPDWSISQLECDFNANPDAIDLKAKGMFTCKNGLKIQLNAPSIRVGGQNAFFDVRLEEGNWDFLRAVGTKEGSKIKIDSGKSHLFGSKVSVTDLLWESDTLSKGRIHTILKWPIVYLFLDKAGYSPDFEVPCAEIEVDGYFDRDNQLGVCLTGGDWIAQAEYKKKLWKLTASNKQLAASCDLFTSSNSLFQLKKGILTYKDLLSFDFEGKVFENFSANLLLHNIQADAEVFQVEGLRGRLDGYGCMNINHGVVESDLDIKPVTLNWNNFQFESGSPVHLFCSSDNGVLLKGLKARLSKGSLEATGEIDLIEFNKPQGHWTIQRSTFHLPTDLLAEISPLILKGIDSGQQLDVEGNCTFSADLSTCHGTIARGSIPIGGQQRHVEDFTFSLFPNHLTASTSILYQDKWAKLTADIHQDTNLHGVISVQDGSKMPLSVRWNHTDAGLSIHSIVGSFAGVDAAFYSTQSSLSGTATIDFHKLCAWIPSDIASGFHEVGLGKGYQIKGALNLDCHDLSKSSFHGILAGKQIEFFGLEFRTLMAQAEITPEKIHFKDIKISDSSVTAKIDEVLIQSEAKGPWTIQIPSLNLEELRPSLLRKPGQLAKGLSPLIVREFHMKGFNGLLSDGNTYRAEGGLTFINTFKREETFFDLPSNFFGRIVGIDLDLLVPVIGELSYKLKDGFFQLDELKNAYSEGKRSEFFLVDTDTSQRVDLKGNIQILVKMKQFVLFALTEGFMISIEGNLSDPHFSLQKKLKF